MNESSNVRRFAANFVATAIAAVRERVSPGVKRLPRLGGENGVDEAVGRVDFGDDGRRMAEFGEHYRP